LADLSVGSIILKVRDKFLYGVFGRVFSLPILIEDGFLLKLKGKVCTGCVRSCLICGSETWPVNVEHKVRFFCSKVKNK